MTTVARLKLSRLLELYTPCNASRTAALDALRKGVDEFEAEVRADERAQVLAAQPATIPLNFTEAPAPATPADPQFMSVADAEDAAKVKQWPGLADTPIIPPADVTTVADLVPPVLTPSSDNVVVDPKPDVSNRRNRR